MINLRTLLALSLIAIAVLIGAIQVYHASKEGPKISPNGKALNASASIIEEASNTLKEHPSQGTSYLALLELETSLEELPPEEAEKTIIDYLETGKDAHTGLQFLLDANGFLETAPTLRVFLLDQLGIIHPESAAGYSKTVLEEQSTPDEWAVALRNYVRELDGPPGENPFLKEKLQALLTRESWTEAPTLGYLQAYDLIVFYGGDAFIPELSRQIENDANPAAQYAARLTLDRLAIHDYTTTVGAILKDMNALKNSPATRARILARADVRDAKECALLKTYLLDPSLSQEELNAFAQRFPNTTLEVSYNLVTQEKRAPLSPHSEQDQTSLAIIQAFLKEDSLTETQSTALTSLEKRLSAMHESSAHGEQQLAEVQSPTAL